MATPISTGALAWQCFQAGDFQQSEQLFRQVLQAEPGHADAWCFLGVLCKKRGAFDEAEACYREALRFKPELIEARNNLGNVLVAQRRMEEAAACYRQVLEMKPDYAEAHNNLGVALRHQGYLLEAAASYDQALRLKPQYPEAHNNRGDILLALGKIEEAVASYQEAVRLRPSSADFLNNLGVALRAAGRFEEALGTYEQAIRLKPEYAEAHYNLGFAFSEHGRPSDAEPYFRQALALRPDYAEALFRLGQTMRALGRLDEGRICFEQVTELAPRDPEAHLARALSLLYLGNFERGWAEYVWRWQCKEFSRPPWPQPLWDGSPLEGRTIVLHAEQGLGDTIHFVRYAPLVQGRGGRVLVACQSSLIRLLSRCAGIEVCVAQDAPLPAHDVCAPLLSLPALLGTTQATLPANVPYLSADPALVVHWHEEVQAFPGFRIGISWQGNPRNRGDRYRSVPLAQFAPLAAVPGVRLFSLQKGPGTEQLSTIGFPVIDLGSRLDEVSGPFEDTAAAFQNLDLVITVDSVVAHLAGALARPTWIVLGAQSDFRWLLAGEDTPWYPTARLFRQERWDSWEPVFVQLARELHRFAAGCAHEKNQ